MQAFTVINKDGGEVPAAYEADRYKSRSGASISQSP
jgi:hypothetical protein